MQITDIHKVEKKIVSTSVLLVMKNIQLGDQTLYRKILLRNMLIYY